MELDLFPKSSRAALPDHGTTPAELLAAADSALLRAKEEGRDRVLIAEVSPNRSV